MLHYDSSVQSSRRQQPSLAATLSGASELTSTLDAAQAQKKTSASLQSKKEEIAALQAEKAAPAVVFALPKIHGRPPTPPQETKTAEQLAVEKLAPGRSSPPGSLQMCCYLCR